MLQDIYIKVTYCYVLFNFDWLSSCSSFPIRVILFIKGTVVVKSKFWFQFYVFSEILEPLVFSSLFFFPLSERACCTGVYGIWTQFLGSCDYGQEISRDPVRRLGTVDCVAITIFLNPIHSWMDNRVADPRNSIIPSLFAFSSIVPFSYVHFSISICRSWKLYEALLLSHQIQCQTGTSIGSSVPSLIMKWFLRKCWKYIYSSRSYWVRIEILKVWIGQFLHIYIYTSWWG